MACVGIELYVAQTVCHSSSHSLSGAGITGVCVSTCSTLLTGGNKNQKLKMFSQNVTAEKKKKEWRMWLSGKDPLNFSVS